MPHDSRDGVLVVGQHRAAIRTGRLRAVMAGGGDGLQIGLHACADEQARVTPAFILVEPVERMTGGDAGLATGAGIEIHLEGVLFPGIRSAERDKMGETITNRR